MEQPAPSESDLAKARRARTLLFVLMAAFIALPLVLLLMTSR